MNYVFIILVLMIAIPWLLFALVGPFSSKNARGWKRWVAFVATLFLFMGALGFFGAGLSAAGGLNWLPDSFEWPVGYVNNVCTTKEGLHVVRHVPTARIQIYDASWNFIHGWHVDNAYGRDIKIAVLPDDHIKVTTPGNIGTIFVFDLDGRELSREKDTQAFSSMPECGESRFVPTPFWLWTFTHPFYSWGAAFLGLFIFIQLDKDRRKRKNAAGKIDKID